MQDVCVLPMQEAECSVLQNMPFDPSLPDLHLELTSKCRLACPACARTVEAGQYQETELSLSAIDRLVKARQRFKMINLSGAHGDPIYHSRFHEVIEKLLRLEGEPFVGIETNGSYRDQDWWAMTGALLRSKDQVVFGIDGLQDTIGLYRRNADWSSIILGIETLKKKSSCVVHWRWILFRHNQHQIEEAARLARSLGVDHFTIVGSLQDPSIDGMQPTISVEDAENTLRGTFDLSKV